MMRVRCDYNPDPKDREENEGPGWRPGWILGFLHNSTNEVTCAIVERHSGKLMEIPLHRVRTSFSPIKET